MSRFSELWPDSTYMISTVETPQGLWNVYVVSIPPNQVAVRQSRQDGEYEFGMVDDQVWHIAYGKAQPTPLGPEWAWFLRNHELFRFSEWLRTLEFNDRIAKTAKLDSASACDLLRATDRFNLEVVLCITGSGNVEWIEREAPAAYGGGIVRIEIDQWGEYLGRSYLKRYRQIQGDRQFHWEIQAIYEVAPGEAVEPPPGIELD